MGSRMELLHKAEAPERREVASIKHNLGQLHGRTEKVLMKGVDAVITGSIASLGERERIRDKRKDLGRRCRHASSRIVGMHEEAAKILVNLAAAVDDGGDEAAAATRTTGSLTPTT